MWSCKGKREQVLGEGFSYMEILLANNDKAHGNEGSVSEKGVPKEGRSGFQWHANRNGLFPKMRP